MKGTEAKFGHPATFSTLRINSKQKADTLWRCAAFIEFVSIFLVIGADAVTILMGHYSGYRVSLYNSMVSCVAGNEEASLIEMMVIALVFKTDNNLVEPEATIVFIQKDDGFIVNNVGLAPHCNKVFSCFLFRSSKIYSDETFS